MCRILCITTPQLEYVLNNIDKYYYLKSTPKLNKKTGEQLINKNGKPRTRDMYPSKDLLKEIQNKLYHKILKKIKLPEYAFGGIEGRDNVTNAKMHQGNKFFFNTDLRNYYPSITHKHVFEMLLKRGFKVELANAVTKLTTYKGQLPQGTPTSPFIANLVFVKAGKELQMLCEVHGLTMTTFVDDITISSKNDFQALIPDLIKIITSNGFTISNDKTFYQTKRPKVTNVIVMNNGLRLDKKYKDIMDSIEDQTSAEAKGKKNYFDRVKKIGKMRLSMVKKKIEKKSQS